MTQIIIPRLIDVPSVSPGSLPAVTRIEAAYERVREEIAAVSEDEFASMNVDVPVAVSTVKTAAPGLLALRQAIATELPSFPLDKLDKLTDYADALAFVHTEFKRDDEPQGALPAMYESALAFRETLVTTGRLLVSLRLIEASVFASAGSTKGYRNVGYELISLCTTLLEKQPQLAGRCPLTVEQLVRGKTLGNMLIDGVAERDRDNARSSGAQRERLRAYTLLARAYDQVRRAVVYLRWDEGDVDALAPSFFATRGGARKPSQASETSQASEAPGAATERETSGARAPAPNAPSAEPVERDESRGDPLFVAPSDDPFASS